MRHTRKNAYDKNAHTFAVCAYGDSPYLEECVCSLLTQRVRTRILIATSTPVDSVVSLARRYELPLYINRGKSGLAGDWNFALQCAGTPLVTLAHQDDRYGEDYTERILEALNGCDHPLLAFTDYCELRNGQRVETNRLLRVKRRMLLPMKFSLLWGNRFARRRILSLGNPICCPSVTLVKENLPGFAFADHMKSNIDWLAWEEISRKRGEFVYIPEPCVEHRIHLDSATSRILEEKGRRAEDLQVLERFWPARIAGMIETVYQNGERSNELKQGEKPCRKFR